MEPLGYGILCLVLVFLTNLCLDRIPKGQSLLRPGPYCPRCKTILVWYEWIPILSLLHNQGRCSNCRWPVTKRFLLIDLMSFFWLGIVAIRFGLTPAGFFQALLGLTIIIVAAIEVEHHRIPDSILLFLTMLVTVEILANHAEDFPFAFLGLSAGAAAVGGYDLLKSVAGRGDTYYSRAIKLGAVLGLFLGWPDIVLGLFLAIFFGAFVGALNIRFRGMGPTKAIIPLPILLAVAALTTEFAGDYLINMYADLLSL